MNAWLRCLELDEYTASLEDQGYKTVASVVDITWEDLEDLNITKLGHQKKILRAIKRISDILAGKRGAIVPNQDNIYSEKKKSYQVRFLL